MARSEIATIAFAALLASGCSLLLDAEDHRDGTGADLGARDASTSDAGSDDLGADDASVDSGEPDLGDMTECGVLALTGGTSLSAPITEYAVRTFTLEAWVRPDTTGVSNSKNIAGRFVRYMTPGAGSYALYLNDGRASLAISCDGEDFHQATASALLEAGEWAHVAGTFDSESQMLTVWVNGAMGGSMMAPCSAPFELTDTPFQIAYNDPAGGDPFTGSVDEVRLSAVVRYDTPFLPPVTHAADSATIALYRFEEPEAPFTDDSMIANPSVPSSSGAAYDRDCSRGATTP